MKLDPAMEHIASLSEFSARPFILSCTYIQDIHKEENNSGALLSPLLYKRAAVSVI